MAKKEKDEACCGQGDAACCKVDAVVTVDERGQMVLPKDVRKKANIKPGDKFALICIQKGGDIYCLSLIRVDELSDMVRGMLGPVMGEIFRGNEGGG